MNTTAITPFQPYVVEVEGALFAISNQVAAVFGKEHKNVLRAIDDIKARLSRLAREPRNLIAPPKPGEPKEPSASDFVESAYTDPRGKEQRCILMTRDALILLVMGFTGEAALRCQVAYITLFNRMEYALHGDRDSDLNRLRRRVEQRYPLFKSLREDYVMRALSMPALCEKYGKSPDSLRNMGHAMVREGYVREEELVLARRGLAVWNALVAQRSQMSLDLAPA